MCSMRYTSTVILSKTCLLKNAYHPRFCFTWKKIAHLSEIFDILPKNFSLKDIVTDLLWSTERDIITARAAKIHVAALSAKCNTYS